MFPSSLAAASLPSNGSNTCLDSLVALGVAGTDKTSSPLPLSSPMAASSGSVVTDSRRSPGRDAKTGADALCCESLDRIADNDGKESTARREACCLGDAVCSHTPNWVGRDFMFVRRPLQERLL